VNGTCPICGTIGRLTCHHITGRVRGKPIHELFVVFICGQCNNVQFQLWHVAGIDDEEPDVEVLLRRIACWLAISDRKSDRLLAEVLDDLAARLVEAA
jgi:hypothetical protein